MKPVLFILFLLNCLPIFAQQKPVVIKSNIENISIREGNKLYKNAWRISPQEKPDVHVTDVTGLSTTVTFITDVDSIKHIVKPGQSYTFIILLKGKDSAYTEIRGVKATKAASFSPAYIKAHTGKTFTEIPEVYELVNILFSITPTYQKDQWAVSRNSSYYADVMGSFGKYAKDPFVISLDSQLKKDQYFNLKMDAYAFEFDAANNIVPGKVYDRVSWGKTNTLKPFVSGLQAFAAKSNFRNFYKEHVAFYNEQIADYRDSINTKEMVKWLSKNFPGTSYNSFKIIWSPLVGSNQSANWFEDNGFKEMQAHVNYPYPQNMVAMGISKQAYEMYRGNIVFTEINHSFINPEGEKPQYAKGIEQAFDTLSFWANGPAAKNYGNAYACFNEYMNWALVPLRYSDYAPAADMAKLVEGIDNMMVNSRGFKRFKAFDSFLLNLYKQRPVGTTIAALYPQIVNWFVANKHQL